MKSRLKHFSFDDIQIIHYAKMLKTRGLGENSSRKQNGKTINNIIM